MALNPKNLLKAHNLKPNKLLGQNFLIDKSAIRKIVAAANLKPKDTVLEIGPGLGVLTFELAKKAKKVIAVEKDPDLARILKQEAKSKNIEILQGDILKVLDSKLLKAGPYKVAGSLPFYLTARLIRQLLEKTNKPSEMVLVVQKEVGQRICSKPPDMSLLAVSVQFHADPKIISFISKKSFWPQPEVDAAIVKITALKSKLPKTKELLFFKIVKAGFSRPRKQLINNLSKGLGVDKIRIGEWLIKNNVQPNQRAETLCVENWISLVKTFFNNYGKT